jgi:hypothetical protein
MVAGHLRVIASAKSWTKKEERDIFDHQASQMEHECPSWLPKSVPTTINPPPEMARGLRQSLGEEWILRIFDTR